MSDSSRHASRLLGGGGRLLLAAAAGALLALSLALGAALLGGAASLASLATEKYANRSTIKKISKNMQDYLAGGAASTSLGSHDYELDVFSTGHNQTRETEFQINKCEEMVTRAIETRKSKERIQK